MVHGLTSLPTYGGTWASLPTYGGTWASLPSYTRFTVV